MKKRLRRFCGWSLPYKVVTVKAGSLMKKRLRPDDFIVLSSFFEKFSQSRFADEEAIETLNDVIANKPIAEVKAGSLMKKRLRLSAKSTDAGASKSSVKAGSLMKKRLRLLCLAMSRAISSQAVVSKPVR